VLTGCSANVDNNQIALNTDVMLSLTPAIIAVWFIVCCSAQAQEPMPAQLRIRAVAPALPILVSSADGLKASGGQAVEILNEVARRAGVKVDVEIQPWSRAMHTASSSKNVLLFPLTRTMERESTFEWIGPVNRVEYWVFKRANGTAKAAKTMHELENASIGTLANDALTLFLRAEIPQAHFQSIAKYESLVPMLMAGRFDYLISTRATTLQFAEQAGFHRSDLQPLFKVRANLADERSYLVMVKGSDPAVIKLLGDAFKAMEKDGSWEKIYLQYQ
jgi:polar amino acid transport system substrate-binding protein